MKGQFRVLASPLRWGFCDRLFLSNQITTEGQQEYLKMIFRAESVIAAGGNFYFGLTHLVPEPGHTLADVVAQEPTIGVNGYARQAVTRDATGWPTITTAADETLIRSKQVTWTASGGSFDKQVSRIFITDQATGSTGILYALSAAFGDGQTLLDTESLQLQYEAFLY